MSDEFQWKSPNSSKSEFKIQDANLSDEKPKTFKWSPHEAAREAERRKAIQQAEESKRKDLLDLEIGITEFKIRTMEKIRGYCDARENNIKLNESNEIIDNSNNNELEEDNYDDYSLFNDFIDPYYN